MTDLPELSERDVEAIQAHALRIFARMKQTPPGPKRSLLTEQYLAKTDEAKRAEGWNEAVNAYRTPQLVERAGVVEALSDLEMACDLICEAKGVEGPEGGYVTDHLDAAEGWLDRVRAALDALGGDDADGSAAK